MPHSKRLLILIATAFATFVWLKVLTVLLSYVPIGALVGIWPLMLVILGVLVTLVPLLMLRAFKVSRAEPIAIFASFNAIIMYAFPIVASQTFMLIASAGIFVANFLLFDAIFNRSSLESRFKLMLATAITLTIMLLWQSIITWMMA